MSDIDKIIKDLSYKIKAEEIGLASWKGSHGKPEAIKPLSKDYLLNSASKMQDAIQKRNEMIDDYIDEQRTPITRFNPLTGEYEKFNFHSIPTPELNLNSVSIQWPDGSRDDIEPQDFENFMIKKDVHKSQIITHYNDKADNLRKAIKNFEDEITESNSNIAILEERKKILLDNLTNKKKEDDDREIKSIDDELESYEDRKITKQLKKRIDDIKRRKNDLLKNKTPLSSREDREKLNSFDRDEMINRNKRADAVRKISMAKNKLRQVLNDKDDSIENFDESIAKIQKTTKDNEKKLEAYAKELNDLNRGELSTVRERGETDEDYLDRMQREADIPFRDTRTLLKAEMKQKQRLRENLKNIIRDESKISQVINSLPPDLYFEVNKSFPGFAREFIKLYGVDNKNISAQNIEYEIIKFFRKIKPPTDLVPVNPSFPSMHMPMYDSDDGNEFNLQFLSSSDEEEEPEIIAETPLEEGEKIEAILQDDYTTIKLQIFKDGKAVSNKKIFIKMYGDDFKKRKVITGPRGSAKYTNVTGVTFYISPSGQKYSYNLVSYNKLLEIIRDKLNATMDQIKRFFGIKSGKKPTVENIATQLSEWGLQFAKSEPTETGDIEGEYYTIGYGVSKDLQIPEKVKFGSNFLLWKKLHLKNILSLQKPNGLKIHGFSNAHVSDDFVDVIAKLLQNKTPSNVTLNKLSTKEKLLLDNMLILCELNKKFVTGSSTDSLNHLKNEYQICLGEIEAGNNNIMLLDKIKNILLKMSHFGAISYNQAMDHFKEIKKNYF